MGLFEYLTRNNKVGVMMDEKEAYDKVRRTTVLKKVAEKKGPRFSRADCLMKVKAQRNGKVSLKMFFPKTLIGWIHRRFGNLPNDIVFTIFAIYDSLQSETL